MIELNKLIDFILLYSKGNGIPITPIKLQQILYYLQAWNIAYFDKKLLFNEIPKAWFSGPVFESVYKRYEDCYYDNTDITNNLPTDNIASRLKSNENDFNFSKKQYDVFFSVLKHYVIMEHTQLLFTTKSELPWNQARENCGEFDECNEPISIDNMYNYYHKFIEQKIAKEFV